MALSAIRCSDPPSPHDGSVSPRIRLSLAPAWRGSRPAHRHFPGARNLDDAPATPADPVKGIDEGLDRLDEFQLRHTVLAFPHAVVKRYSEDRGGWLGVAISYHGFFSLLPALLAFATFVHAVLGANPTLLEEVLAALWATLPFASADAIRRVEPISGSGPVLVISLLISIWGAARVVRVLQDALDLMWY